MKVNTSFDQAETILNALINDHLCDECEFDENHDVVKGTECPTEKLIQKYKNIVSGKSRRNGFVGGCASKLKQRDEKTRIINEMLLHRSDLNHARTLLEENKE